MTSRLRTALLPAWVDRTIGIVFAARLCMSAARAVASVVTALYLAADGFSAVEIGLLFLCVGVATACLASGVGMLSDRVGRKPFMIAVPLLAALAAAVYAMTTNPAVLFAAAALGSFGRGAGAGGGNVGPYQPAESALVAEAAPASARASAFSRLTFFSLLGALAGGLLAALAGNSHHLSAAAAASAYRPAFISASVLAAVSGTLSFWLREPRADRPAGAGHARIRFPRRSWPALWRLSVTNAINGLAMGVIGPFMSYWLYLRYGASAAAIGLLFALVNLGSLVSALTAAPLARRLGTVRAIVIVRALAAALLVPMALAPAYWMAGAIYFIRMVVQRVGLPLRLSFVQDLADPSERASVAALSALPAQATMAGSQVLAGYLFEEVALAAPFMVAAAAQFVTAVLYAGFFGRRGAISARSAPAGQPADDGDAPDPLGAHDACAGRLSAQAAGGDGVREVACGRELLSGQWADRALSAVRPPGSAAIIVRPVEPVSGLRPSNFCDE
jgi:MFS family permease